MLPSRLTALRAARCSKSVTRISLPRFLASEAKDLPPVTDTNRLQATLKRFWKSVALTAEDDHFLVTLDNKPLKTPAGNKLRIPKHKPLLATLIANEWETQETFIKAHALPLTSIASRAIDDCAVEATRLGVIEALLKYFDTDTICYHQSEPASLVKLQDAHWKPIIDWARSQQIDVKVFESILIGKQPADAMERLRKRISRYDEWKVAGLERSVHSTKSILISVALLEGRINVEEAARAAHVEVNSQIQRWGEVEDSHDVDFHDLRKQLGSVSCAILGS